MIKHSAAKGHCRSGRYSRSLLESHSMASMLSGSLIELQSRRSIFTLGLFLECWISVRNQHFATNWARYLR
jgi:hypothetical protein